ncbi:N-acyl homoserine lactonase family protein [Ahrensia sp. R2A130]|uniref:N-acyl homoserine lactonase family protein n=1 Tax=Ahrensia sp. R2A130 TaxID=744979 RepID=UPI0001E0D16A|nr:N-acyl homoserine lactonase family protein [Ahrensia sp. R2A130]EFL87707.1 beta-lactamase domain-containing protein [Ahrensia sp. R2A130]
MSENHWDVLALRYATRANRTRAASFLLEEDIHAAHPIDYFLWVLRNEAGRVVVVDTGYDTAEANARDRPILHEPTDMLAGIGVDIETVTDVIITHLHYDHAGCLAKFPNARFHLQEAEMQYATGPCMCSEVMQDPFSVSHVCDMVRHVYSGRVTFADGAAQVAPGVTVHKAGGHSRGLQCVRVETAKGPLVLASDVAHFYENFLERKPFPIVVDVEDSLKAFTLLETLVDDRNRVIPGHDPLVCERFPLLGAGPEVYRLT